MLKFLVRIIYHDRIYTDEPKTFYKLYKWHLGLYVFLSFQRIIFAFLLCLTSCILLYFHDLRPFRLICIFFALLLLILELIEIRKQYEFNFIGIKTNRQIKLIHLENFIMKFISKNGKALGRKEWKAIKETDINLYNDLLCDECDHCCYYYSLEIAKIIKDSTLMWIGVEEPFDSDHKYYAHAVILRNSYIYDSNMRQSESYEDFFKLYKAKLYKNWKYDQYSKNDFRECERLEFRKWCRENNILVYDKF